MVDIRSIPGVPPILHREDETSTVITSLLVSLALCIVCVVLFLVFRRMKRFRGIFHRRHNLSLLQLVQLSDTALLQYASLESVLYLRFVKLLLRIACCVMLVGVPLSIVYSKASGECDPVTAMITHCEAKHGPQYLRMTILNTASTPELLWIVPCSFFVITAIVFYLLYSEYMSSLQLVQEYRLGMHSRHIAKNDAVDNNHTAFVPRVEWYTVVVEGVPVAYRNPSGLKQFFSLGTGGIRHASMLVTNPELLALVRRHKLLKGQVRVLQARARVESDQQRKEDLAVKLHQCMQERCAVSGRVRELWGDQGDHLKRQSDCAVVTFRSLSHASLVASSGLLHSSAVDRWHVTPCPPVQEIIWDNMGMSMDERASRSVYVNLAAASMVLWWSIPVAALMSLVAVDPLQQQFPVLNFLDQTPLLKRVVRGFLPAALLSLVLSSVPVMLRMLAVRLGRQRSRTKVTEFGIKAYSLFLGIYSVVVIDVFHSFWSFLTQFLDRPSVVLSQFAAHIPLLGLFFTSFVVVGALASHSCELLNLGHVCALVWRRIRAKTEVEYEAIEKQQSERMVFRFDKHVPTHVLILFLTLLYSVQVPLMMPFCVLYFGTGYVVHLHQLLLVEDSHGFSVSSYPLLADCVLVCIVLAQSLVAGILFNMGASYEGFVMIALIVFTTWFSSTLRRYHDSFLFVFREDALKLDERTGSRTPDCGTLDVQEVLASEAEQGCMQIIERHLVASHSRSSLTADSLKLTIS